MAIVSCWADKVIAKPLATYCGTDYLVMNVVVCSKHCKEDAWFYILVHQLPFLDYKDFDTCSYCLHDTAHS